MVAGGGGCGPRGRGGLVEGCIFRELKILVEDVPVDKAVTGVGASHCGWLSHRNLSREPGRLPNSSAKSNSELSLKYGEPNGDPFVTISGSPGKSVKPGSQ